MNLQIKKGNKYIIIYLTSPIDAKTAVEIEEELNRIIQHNLDKDVIVNLSGVKYISSSGLRVFIAIKNMMIDTNQNLKVCSMVENVKKVFDMTRVSELFEMYSTEELALEKY